jgi:hypothetical protein
MAYRPRGRARVNPDDPRSFAVCDRCGFLFNHSDLTFQHQWQGVKLQNKRILVCENCSDKPSQFLRAITLPPDPTPIFNVRPEYYSIDEFGSYPPLVQLFGAGQVVSPSWATAFIASAVGSGSGGGNLNGSYSNPGGGGGAYAKTNRVPILGGATVYYNSGVTSIAGAAGLPAWINAAANIAPTNKATGVLAAGASAAFAPTPGIGGLAAACIGDIAFSGGSGGQLGGTSATVTGGSGGGGAAGPTGAGLNGVDAMSGTNGTKGGGSNTNVTTGGAGGIGAVDTTPIMALPNGNGTNGRADSAFGTAGCGGGGGAGGGGLFVYGSGVGGDGGSFGGGGGGGGYANVTNGIGGQGQSGVCYIQWLRGS